MASYDVASTIHQCLPEAEVVEVDEEEVLAEPARTAAHCAAHTLRGVSEREREG